MLLVIEINNSLFDVISFGSCGRLQLKAFLLICITQSRSIDFVSPN